MLQKAIFVIFVIILLISWNIKPVEAASSGYIENISTTTYVNESTTIVSGWENNDHCAHGLLA